MVSDQLLAVLYEGLCEALESPVTRIEPLKIFTHTTSQSVVLFRVQLSGSPEIYVWAKTLGPSSAIGLREKRIMRDYDLNRHLYSALDQSGPFRVPRPLFHSPEHRLIVTEHMAGQVLQNKIARGARWMSSGTQKKTLETDCYQVGKWLHAFQEATRGYCPGTGSGLDRLKVKDLGRIAEQTTERMEALSQNDATALDPQVAIEIKDFMLENNQINQSDGAFEKDCICSVHGDFFPANLISSGNAIIGLDFTGSTWGSRYYDLSYFVFQVETLCQKIRYPKSMETRLIAAFVKGYNDIDLEGSFWGLSPEIESNYVSHCVSRLSYLANSRRNTLDPRILYRRFEFYRTRKKLIHHVRRGRLKHV